MKNLSESILYNLNESGELMVSMPLSLINDLTDSLASMTDYADDGMLNRNDPEYKDFFEAVDKARETLEQSNKYVDDYLNNNSIHTMLNDED